MDNDNKTVVNSGIGFEAVLTLIFITLKLLGKITWSWWWVLSPIWIPLVLSLLTLIIVVLILKK